MPLLNPYTTVDAVRSEIRNVSPESCPDSTIEDAINAGSRFIEQWTGRDYFFRDYSTTALTVRKADLRIVDDMLYLLDIGPVITLTEVIVGGVTWVVDDDYVIMPDRMRILALGGEWPVGNLPEAVTTLKGTFGYAEAAEAPTENPSPDLPPNVKRACTLIAAALTSQNQKDVAGLDGHPISILDKMIPKAAFQLLGPRKLMT